MGQDDQRHLGENAGMVVSVHIGEEIYCLQANGGISRVWRALTPPLHDALPDAVWNGAEHADVYLPTYYSLPVNGARSVVMVYDMIHERIRSLNYHPDAIAKRAAIERADRLLAISKATADDILRYTGKKAEVAHCGGGEVFQRVLPDAAAAFKAQYELDRYVMLVGKRGLYKNAQALYQAWPFFAGAETHTILAVGGESPGAAEATFMARFPKQWRRVNLDDTALAAAYSGAAALIYPSYAEGFGLPVLEAMACGCPVICSPLSSLPEVAGDAALYVDVFRPLSIASALNALLDPSRRLEHVMKGYERAKLFSWQGMAEITAEAIRGVA